MIFLLKGTKTSVVMIAFRLGWAESWIVKLKTFIMDSALKKKQHIFWTFYWYKDNLSGNFLCAKNFFGKISKPPKRFGFWLVTVSFYLLRWHLRPRHAACAQKRKTNLRSHDLKTDRSIDKDRWRQVNTSIRVKNNRLKYRKETRSNEKPRSRSIFERPSELYFDFPISRSLWHMLESR